jgi:hypothetical protein
MYYSNLIMKGCEECPKSEDVWLEAARLMVIFYTNHIMFRVVLLYGCVVIVAKPNLHANLKRWPL